MKLKNTVLHSLQVFKYSFVSVSDCRLEPRPLEALFALVKNLDHVYCRYSVNRSIDQYSGR